MSVKSTFLFSTIILLFAASCKKDNSASGSGNALQGNWTYVSMSANTQSTVWDTVGGITEKSVTISSYKTTNNGGTVIIKADSMYSVGLTYTMVGSATGYIYEDNQFIDSMVYPLNVPIPPMSAVSKYQLIGKDSLYFPGGGFLSAPGLSGTQTISSGGKFTLSGNTLTMTSRINQTTNENQGGVNLTKNAQAVVTTILQKQ